MHQWIRSFWLHEYVYLFANIMHPMSSKHAPHSVDVAHIFHYTFRTMQNRRWTEWVDNARQCTCCGPKKRAKFTSTCECGESGWKRHGIYHYSPPFSFTWTENAMIPALFILSFNWKIQSYLKIADLFVPQIRVKKLPGLISSSN